LKKSCGTRKDSLKQPYLTEGKAQLSGHEREEEIDGICETVIEKMKSTEGK